MSSALRHGETVIGSWVSSGSPIVAELMAQCGFDFLAIDAEHGPIDVPQTYRLFQAIRSGSADCTPLVRLPGSSYETTKRYMDAGASGVIAPLINTPEQAEELVSAVKYPPQGERGVGFCRANDYGMTLESSITSANRQSFVCIQIEHIQGVKNIDSILTIPGIDAVFIGPYDLSASMGITAQFDNKDFIAVKAEVLAACEKSGIAAGIHVVQPDPEETKKRISEGYRLLAYSLDITILTHFCISGLKELMP